MKTMTLYNVILGTDMGRISGVKHYFTKEDALKALRKCYADDIEYLERRKLMYESDKDFERADEGWTYDLHYDSRGSFYHGEVVKSVIAIPDGLMQ